MNLYPVLQAWILGNLLAGERDKREAIFRDISEKHFDGNFVSVFYSNSNPRNPKHGLLNMVKGLSASWTVQLYSNEVRANILRNVKPEMILILFEGIHSERAILARIRKFRNNYAWNPRAKIILMAEGDEDAPKVYMSSMWKLYRSANLVLWMFDRGQFFVWEPYKKGQCDVVETIRKASPDELFRPLDLTNLNGCTVTATADFMPPFTLRRNNFTMMYDRGVESKVMEIIAESVNAQLRYIEIPQTEKFWDWETKDGKVNGAIAMLERQEVDVAFSGLSLNFNRVKYAESLTSHFQDEIVWFVPVPPRRNPIQSLHSMFSVSVWIAVYTMSVVIGILMYYDDRTMSVTESLMATLYASLNMPIKTNSKLLPMLLYYGSMHIVTAYQAMLLFFLVSDLRGKPIETLQEAVDAKLFAYMPPSLKIYFNMTEHHLWNEILKPGRYSLSYRVIEQIADIVKNKSAMALLPKFTTMYGINKIYPDGNNGPKVLMLPKRLAISSLAFFMPMGHPLKPVFDYKVNQIISAGFTQVWMQRYLSKRFWTGAKDALTVERKSLKLTNLVFIFYLYASLMLGSFLAFLLEILHHYFTIRRRSNLK